MAVPTEERTSRMTAKHSKYTSILELDQGVHLVTYVLSAYRLLADCLRSGMVNEATGGGASWNWE